MSQNKSKVKIEPADEEEDEWSNVLLKPVRVKLEAAPFTPAVNRELQEESEPSEELPVPKRREA